MLSEALTEYLDYLTQDVEDAPAKAATWMQTATASYIKGRFQLTFPEAMEAVSVWAARKQAAARA